MLEPGAWSLMRRNSHPFQLCAESPCRLRHVQPSIAPFFVVAGFMLVLEGQLTETVYGADAILPDGKSVWARMGKARQHVAGTLAYINDSMGLHKVGNVTDARAVSLHVCDGRSNLRAASRCVALRSHKHLTKACSYRSTPQAGVSRTSLTRYSPRSMPAGRR